MSASKMLQIIDHLTAGTTAGKIVWKADSDPRGETYVTALPTGQAFQLSLRQSGHIGTINLEVRDAEDSITAEISSVRGALLAAGFRSDLTPDSEGEALWALVGAARKQTEAPLDDTLKALEQLTSM